MNSVVLIIAAVQFVNILDFMMVMPLGPDFARDLGIPISHLGMIGGAYTAAACVSGLLGSTFLDRFERKRALVVALSGLTLATVAATLADSYHGLLFARVMAGAFGGPATAVAISIISDVIPPEKRGRAMGTVMSSFAIASIVGVPAGLELARLGGWKMPFYGVGALGLLVTLLAWGMLPELRGHLTRVKSQAEQDQNFAEKFFRPLYLLSFLAMALGTFASFLLIPNISAYLQFNWSFPRESMGFLYLAGGACALISTKLGGAWQDRVGANRPLWLSSSIIALCLTFGFIWPIHSIPVVLIFSAFMVGNSLRFVTLNTLVSKVPEPGVRAQFTSLLSAVQHAASAGAAMLSTLLLSEGEGHQLIGVPLLASLALGLSVIMVVVVMSIQIQVKGRAAVAIVTEAH